MNTQNFLDAKAEKAELYQLASLVSGQLLPIDVPAAQWPELVETALTNGLAPMLFMALKASGINPVSVANGDALVDSVYQAALADILYESSMRSITQALTAKRIPVVWLKGADLARTVYPQSNLRPMGDLDVLIPYDQREAALAVMHSLGYVFYNIARFIHEASGRYRKQDEAYLKYLAYYHYSLIGGISNQVKVDLHFGLLEHNSNQLLPELLPEEHIKWFWEQTRSFGTYENGRFTGLKPEAHLLYLAVHHIYHHGESLTPLMRDLDMHLLLTQSCPDWDCIVNQAEILGWTQAVYRSLGRANDFFSTPLPHGILEQLASRRPHHEDSSLSLKINLPGCELESTRNTLSRLPFRLKLRYIYLKIFPCTRFMRSRYAVPPDHFIWPYYPYRWFDQCRIIGNFINWRLRTRVEKRP